MDSNTEASTWTELLPKHVLRRLAEAKSREDRIEVAEKLEYSNRLHHRPFAGLKELMEDKA